MCVCERERQRERERGVCVRDRYRETERESDRVVTQSRFTFVLPFQFGSLYVYYI